MTDSRDQALADWTASVLGGNDWHVEPASTDASFRRYFRVTRGAATWIVMDAPPSLEDTAPFVRISALLVTAGINAPRVLASDSENGFVLLSDLGSQQYLEVLRSAASPEALYDDAICALVRMQAAGERQQWPLPAYDEALLRKEMDLFTDWLLGLHVGCTYSPGQMSASKTFLVENALAQPRVFVHRDYHSRNLMVCPGANPGVLDFQDAVRGPVSYDLVSLLRDCYLRWPDSKIDNWLSRYRSAALDAGLNVGADVGEFRRWFDLMGMQRHLKAAGIFARLNHRDGKPGYLSDIPRTLGYVVDVAHRYPELHWLGALVAERVLPRLETADSP